jgi:iron complex outermembrane recepter protein
MNNSSLSVAWVGMAAWIALCACALGQAPSQTAETPADVITRIDSIRLEDLLNQDVTSVLRKEGKLFEAPAAIFVISGADIRRSGARSIVEALRMAPGMSVAQLDQSLWTVSSRGLDKRRHQRGLQVLVDGRSVYSPAYAGVDWDTVDYLLEDVERIEVIRGPGGAMWGANAVDGVINIITKHTKETHGTFLSGGGGNVQRFGQGRYGMPVGEHGNLRGYAKYSVVDDAGRGADGWDFFQTGFRSDWEFERTWLAFSGDIYQGNLARRRFLSRYSIPSTNEVFLTDFETFGGNVLFHWIQQLGPDSAIEAQTSYDRTERNGLIPDSLIEDKFDIQLQHRLPLPWSQELQYGVGYRYMPSRVRALDSAVVFEPEERHEQLVTFFLQDEIRFFEERLRLILGSRLEHHDPSGWELLPSARLAWLPGENHTLWSAVSRAVRIPDRTQRDTRVRPLEGGPLFFPGVPLPVFFIGEGNPNTEAEKLMAYELGHRWRVDEKLSLDLALFYNRYENLITGEVRTDQSQLVLDPALPRIEIPVSAYNEAEARSYGFELAATWQAAEWWRLIGGYAFVALDADDPLDVTQKGTQPEHQVTFRSSMDLPHNIDFDTWLRFVDSRPAVGIGSYFDLDVRLAWRPTPLIEVAAVGQNLIASRRVEASVPPFFPSEITPVERAFYLQLSLRF